MPKFSTQTYPDTKAIVSGYFEPLDKSRCLVCGAELRGQESTCGERCFGRMCAIQRRYTEEDCERMIESASRHNDPQLSNAAKNRISERIKQALAK